MVAEREPSAPAPATCAGCATGLLPTLLVCPSCGALVHATRLKQLAATAAERESAGDVSGALAAWRAALDLLPEGTRQRAEVAARVARLSSAVTSPSTAGGTWKKIGGGGAIGATLVGLLGKGKLLLLGLTKLTTLGSMLLAFGLYLTLWSWKFALGFVGAIYVHEMGHVFALRRFGIAATAPMFIPGLGALVRLKQHPATATEDATVGLAGPIWGLGAALAAFVVGIAGGGAIWTAIAQAAGMLNLFNLMPLGPLDGGRAFNALTRPQRLLMAAALGGAWLITHNGIALLVLIVAVGRALSPRAPAKGEWRIAVEYLALVGALSYLAALPVTAR